MRVHTSSKANNPFSYFIRNIYCHNDYIILSKQVERCFVHDAFRYLYFRDLTVSDVDRCIILSNRARAGKALIPATTISTWRSRPITLLPRQWESMTAFFYSARVRHSGYKWQNSQCTIQCSAKIHSSHSKCAFQFFQTLYNLIAT